MLILPPNTILTSENRYKSSNMPLSKDNKQRLLDIAHQAIESCLRGEPAPVSGIESEELNEPCGAFVSLHREGALRGCIGIFISEKPLHETIGEMAVAAATKDTRFTPVSSNEFEELDIEISVLSPLEFIDDVTRIEIGRHGLYIVKGYARGVLLPQVATQNGFDRETFLEQTCIKAGLAPDEWQQGAEIFIFEAEVFGHNAQR